MNKIFLFLTLIMFTAFASASMLHSKPALAIEPEVETPKDPELDAVPQMPQEVFRSLPILVECGPANVLMPSVVTKYNEAPFAQMKVMFRTPNGQVLQGLGTITVNKDTGTWTYIVNFENTTNMCVFLQGTEFGPWIEGTKTQTEPKGMPKAGEMPGVTKRVLIDY